MPDLDSIAEVLQRAIDSGDDLSIARMVDFAHLFPDKASAERFADLAEQRGFTGYPSEYDEEPGMWDVTVSREMVPEAESIALFEDQLGELARQLGGDADGWGFISCAP